MEKLKSFEIHRPSTLVSRFSLPSVADLISSDIANWVVYADALPTDLVAQLSSQSDTGWAGEVCRILEVWKVGRYEVALLAGEVSTKQRTWLEQMGIDYANLTDVADLSSPGLIVFDMDSTLIKVECIDEIAKLAGVGEQVAEVTERAMQGELDFSQSLISRVAALQGADISILDQVRESLPLMEEAQMLVYALQHYGWKVALASGGFSYFSEHLKSQLGLDHASANQLDIEHGKLTGKVLGEIVSAQTKADILKSLATEFGIEADNTVAVGDGANDLVMMEAAGFGVAYHAKEKVQRQAQSAVRHADLGGVLCILSAGLMKRNKSNWQILHSSANS